MKNNSSKETPYYNLTEYQYNNKNVTEYWKMILMGAFCTLNI